MKDKLHFKYAKDEENFSKVKRKKKKYTHQKIFKKSKQKLTNK